MTSYAATNIGWDFRRAEAALSAQGLTAREIADQLGVDKRTVQRWRRARRENTMPTPVAIARPAIWQDQAACLGHADTFADDTATAEAKQICARCPVWNECLDDALRLEKGDEKTRAGIRGGKGPEERATLATSRRKAAARKKAAAAAEQARV